MEYIEYPRKDSSFITIQFFDDIESIPYKDKPKSVQKHKHEYHEFVLISKGSCTHLYKDVAIPLIPGDVFLIPAHLAHGYEFNKGDVSIYNCQFYPKELGQQCSRVLNSFTSEIEGDDGYNSVDFVTEMEMIRQRQAEAEPDAKHVANINMQGTIHLNSSELIAVEELLREMLHEQEHKNFGYHFLKQSYLETVLVLVKRAQIRQFYSHESYFTRKQKIIMHTLDYLEEHYAQEIDFEEIAKKEGFTLNYYRTLFKNVTGLSPVDYINRLRVLKSLQLLQTTNMHVSEIAAKVGIFDSNYFTRLFKKIIGYAPTYFKKIE